MVKFHSSYKNRVKGKGWAPDTPSIKDYPFSAFTGVKVTDISAVSMSLDRRDLNPPVMDQGNIGSCVGCSSGYYGVGWLRRTDQDKFSTDYSALFTYYEARVRDGDQFRTVDAGAYIRDAMDALRTVGIPPKSKWPYVATRFAEQPTASVYKAAQAWKLGAHYRCETLEDILLAIASGYAVVGGFTCYSSMFTDEVDRTGRIPMPSPRDSFEGGHAVYLDRFNRSDRLVRFENSWGISWGDGGYGYLPFEYVANRNLSDDFWAMTSESPATTPWKD